MALEDFLEVLMNLYPPSQFGPNQTNSRVPLRDHVRPC
jgi:hypothetical protein